MPSSEQRSANEFEFVVRYEQRKSDLLSTKRWLTGATGFNVSTAPASKNRSELLADSVESTKSAEISTDLFSERGVAAQKTAPR